MANDKKALKTATKDSIFKTPKYGKSGSKIINSKSFLMCNSEIKFSSSSKPLFKTKATSKIQFSDDNIKTLETLKTVDSFEKRNSYMNTNINEETSRLETSIIKSSPRQKSIKKTYRSPTFVLKDVNDLGDSNDNLKSSSPRLKRMYRSSISLMKEYEYNNKQKIQNRTIKRLLTEINEPSSTKNLINFTGITSLDSPIAYQSHRLEKFPSNLPTSKNLPIQKLEKQYRPSLIPNSITKKQKSINTFFLTSTGTAPVPIIPNQVQTNRNFKKELSTTSLNSFKNEIKSHQSPHDSKTNLFSKFSMDNYLTSHKENQNDTEKKKIIPFNKRSLILKLENLDIDANNQVQELNRTDNSYKNLKMSKGGRVNQKNKSDLTTLHTANSSMSNELITQLITEFDKQQEFNNLCKSKIKSFNYSIRPIKVQIDKTQNIGDPLINTIRDEGLPNKEREYLFVRCEKSTKVMHIAPSNKMKQVDAIYKMDSNLLWKCKDSMSEKLETDYRRMQIAEAKYITKSNLLDKQFKKKHETILKLINQNFLIKNRATDSADMFLDNLKVSERSILK